LSDCNIFLQFSLRLSFPPPTQRWKIAFHSFILRQQFDSAEWSAVLISVINAFIPASSTNPTNNNRQASPSSQLYYLLWAQPTHSRMSIYEIKLQLYTSEGKSIRTAYRQKYLGTAWNRNARRMTPELHSAPSTVAALIDGLIEPPLGWMDLCINGCTQPAAAAATAAAAGASEILKSWPKINLDAAGFVAFGAVHAKCCRPDTPERAQRSMRERER
jgi:hypothetical protein